MTVIGSFISRHFVVSGIVLASEKLFAQRPFMTMSESYFMIYFSLFISCRMAHILYLALDELSLSEKHKLTIVDTIQKCGNASLTILITCPNLSTEPIDALWSRLQTLLGSIYAVQLDFCFPDNPLFDCNVVLEPFCGYDFALESGFQCVTAPLEVGRAWNQRRTAAHLPPLTVTALDSLPAKTIADSTPVHAGKFKRVIIGGTFDHMHAGHKILLTMSALLASRTFAVGLTDDSTLKSKKHNELIAPVDVRTQNVRQYLQRARRNIDYELVTIYDPFGPTITDPSFEALVCSKETLKGGELVNKERIKRSFPELELWVIDLISPDNASVNEEDMMALKLSSTWIRAYIANNKHIYS